MEDWKKEFSTTDTTEEIREKIKKFIESIDKSVKQHFEIKSISTYSKPWMNEYVKRAIKNTRKLKMANTKWDNPTTKADLDQTLLSICKSIKFISQEYSFPFTYLFSFLQSQ